MTAKIEYDYWVVRRDGMSDADMPFRAMDEAHAKRWVAQPYVAGTCKVLRRRAIQHDRAWQELVAEGFIAGESMRLLAEQHHIGDEDIETAIRRVMQRGNERCKRRP